MPAFPIPHGNAGSLPRARVQKDYVHQVVDLKPRGNTITVTTLAENPFASRTPISIRTQMSGGMAGADESQKSQRLMHSFMPGFGDVAPAASPTPTAIQIFSSAANTAADLYKVQQARLQQEAIARQQQAQAAAAQSNMMAVLGRSPGITVPLLIVGAGAIGVAIWLKMRKPRGRRR